MNLTRKPKKSAISRADTNTGRLPLFYVSSRAWRLTGWALLHTTVIGGTVGGLWYQHINAAPTITVPVRATPPSNSYPDLVNVASRLADDKEIGKALMWTAPKDPKTKVYTLAEKEALVAENAALLRDLRAQLPHYAEVAPIRDWSTPFPELAKFRAVTRLLALEGQVATAHGQYGKAASAYLDAVELGERIGHGGTLIHKLVSIACESIGRRGLMVVADWLSPDEARVVVTRLEAIDVRQAPMADALTEEKWITQATLDHMFHKQSMWQIATSFAKDYGLEDSEHPLSGAERLKIMALVMRYSKAEVAQAHREYMDAVIANAKLPYDRSRPEPVVPPDYLNQILSPVFNQASHKEADARAQNALLVGKLALNAYRADHHDVPTRLEQAFGGSLGAAPVDPFARNGTDALRFHRTSSTGYVLYSVGPDGVDNGGTPIPPSKDNKNKRWTEAKDNGDFVLGVNYF